MASDEPQLMTVGQGADARRIAVTFSPPTQHGAPTLLWLSGFKSDMGGTKAVAVAEWARQRGYGCLRFDYSGHGRSEGVFTDGTIGRWLEETRAVCKRFARGKVVLIGSSMGGYLALLLVRDHRIAESMPDAKVTGLALIAPAWDMTQELMWKRFPDDVRQQIEVNGLFERPSRYGDGPYPITRRLIEDGRHHLIGGGPLEPGCPVEIIHGRLDPDVPFSHSERLMTLLSGADVRLTAIDDGEHRLSRPEDLDVLFGCLERLTR